jgi:branched-chain amino acid transport system substrate-binding protein
MSVSTKAAVFAFAFAMVGTAATGAMAQTNWERDHPRRDQVNDRLQNQNRRINQEVREGYDAMHLIYEALKKTGGKSDGDALIAAMKGMKWQSPRGPIEIDPSTRDVVHNEYIRKVERVNGTLSNVEFETYPMVKDPVKGAKR